MYHDFCRREREAQDVGDGGVDVARRLGAEEGAHDEAVRLRPARREREGECQGLGHILSLYQQSLFYRCGGLMDAYRVVRRLRAIKYASWVA